ncbi:NUDIX domain-containing protein [Candidatus Woesebacteria bacterium]|nr:NUDIX domain-containing protein [Candidatus Woesebacteria bacterium]
MVDLLQFPAKICFTAAAFLIQDKKILLIKHKKIGLWLAPGGHVEPGELPHRAAERECFEETGVAVRAVDQFFGPGKKYHDSAVIQYFPSPILSNIHWVSQSNYQARTNDPEHYQPIAPWLKGCEQHFNFTYVVEPMGSIETTLDQMETDGIGWFSLEEMKEIETTDDIRFEVSHAFKLLGLG